jgi:hypothetical protein
MARKFAVTAFCLLCCLAALGQSDAQRALDNFKSMAGSWTGKSPRGESAEVTYRLLAGDTTVMAESNLGGEHMTSMFYLDGDRLRMTHFCPSNNQPRMQATISADRKSVLFDFLDATNLPGPQAGHMHRVLYVFLDADHYSEEWTWKQEGKESRMHFDMQRAK